MKANPPAALLLALALAVSGASPAFAQSLPDSAAYLPMGAYTNDFSAPMPDWWFYGTPAYYFDMGSLDSPGRDLSGIVYSNDYATATEGLVQRFAFQATYYLDSFFWMYGGYILNAPSPYLDYVGMLDNYFDLLDAPALPEDAVQTASAFWQKASIVGSDGTPPWNEEAPSGTNCVNIGQVKNAFSFFLVDDDFDSILDDYEYREFGSLEFVDDLFDDPGGDGLCLLVEMLCGLDPLSGPEPFAITTNKTAEVSLFPTLNFSTSPMGAITIYEREFQINRANVWQHYFLARGDTNDCTHRVQILYSDDFGDFHDVAAAFAEGETARAVRLEHVSTNQASLVIRIVTTDDNWNGDYSFSCPSLSLVGWVPKVEFLGLQEIQANGRTYHVAPPGGTDGLVASFSVDWSGIPDGSNPANWPETYDQRLPLEDLGGLAVESDWDEPTHLLTGGEIRPAGAGAFSLDALSALPSAMPPALLRSGSRNGSGAADVLLFLTPSLSWPGSLGRCGTWVDYDPVTGTYTNASAYPLDSASLLENWHFLEDRGCHHAPKPALDLGNPGLTNLVGTSVELVSDDPPTARASVSLGGETLWTDEITHFCADADAPSCHSETPLSDPDCDCEGSETDGDSFGSCAFRLALGFPLLDTVSGFLWFRSEEIPAATPAMLSLLVREGAAVTCQSNNPGGAISHVRCLDPRGRDITVSQMANGLCLVVSNAACTFLDHSWEITNPSGNPSQLNIRKISRLGNPLSDHTYELGAVPAPDAIFAEDSRLWRRTDNLTGLVETRIVSDGLNAPGCRARWIEEIKADAASGALYAYSQSRSALLGKGDRAVLRETNRVERTFDPAHPRETFATYWENPTNRLLHGKARLTWGDRPWSYRAYDALGRETLRLDQLNGSPVPAVLLGGASPETLPAALPLSEGLLPAAAPLAPPGLPPVRASVSSYAPLAGDADDPLDGDLPRTISEYVLRDGAATLVARTWTVVSYGAENGLRTRSVRTERAASPSAAFGDPGNAVSSETSFDAYAAAVPRALRGRPLRAVDKDGVATARDYAFGTLTSDASGAPVFTAAADGPHLRVRKRRSTAEAPLGLPGRAAPVSVLDATWGSELLSASAATLADGGLSDRLFDWTLFAYDDQDRLRATRHSDGSTTTNAYSCCRLLWSRGRDGLRTLRSATTGQDRLYYATEEILAPLVSRDPYYYAPARDNRIVQHFMDAAGRETNTYVRFSRNEGAAVNPNFTPHWASPSFPETTSYPDGVSGRAIRTDRLGVVTATSSHSSQALEVSASETFAPGAGSPHLVTTNLSWRGGGSATLRAWDGGWTLDASFRDWTADGLARDLSLSVSSDGPVVTNSVTTIDFLGRTALSVRSGPEGSALTTSYAYASPSSPRRISSLTTSAPSATSTTSTDLYDALHDPAGAIADDGVAHRFSTIVGEIGGDLWRISAEWDEAGGATGAVSTVRQRLTGLSNALRSETVSTAPGGSAATTTSSYDPSSCILTTASSTDGGTPSVTLELFGVVIETRDRFARRLVYSDATRTPYHVRERDPVTGSSRSTRLLTDIDDRTWLPLVVGEKDGGVYHPVATYAYDALGRRVSSADALGNATTNVYDALGRVVARGGAAHPSATAYDARGRRTALTTRFGADASPATVAWTYDPATGDALRKTYPDGSSVLRSYRPDSLPLRISWARGAWRENLYDASGRLLGVSRSGGAPASAFAYDAFGRTALASNAVASSAFARAAATGLATNEAQTVSGLSAAIRRAPDAVGRPALLAVADAPPVHRVPDADGRLACVSNDAFSAAYAFGTDSRPLGYVLTLPGGHVLTQLVGRAQSIHRDRVTSVSATFDGAPLLSFSYSYDAAGRRIRRVDATPASSATRPISYNGRGEVTAAFGSAYAYDDSGNFLSHAAPEATFAYAPNAANQYVSRLGPDSSASFSYDADGNLTGAETNGVPLLSLAYDAENRPVCASNGPAAVAFAYDALGRRVLKASPSATHAYFYDGWNLVREVVARADGSSSTNDGRRRRPPRHRGQWPLVLPPLRRQRQRRRLRFRDGRDRRVIHLRRLRPDAVRHRLHVLRLPLPLQHQVLRRRDGALLLRLPLLLTRTGAVAHEGPH